jgi:hypothetical protein
MKRALLFVASAAATLLIAGCSTPLPPGAEPGPHNTMAYTVSVDASPPGARIEVNGEDIGPAPVRIKIFGDTDGTFHDFGADYYIVRALPVATNQFPQTRAFRTGHMLGPEDRIPDHIFFDMNQQPAPYASPGYYGPPPVIYGAPYYYEPGFRFYWGPRFYHRRW